MKSAEMVAKYVVIRGGDPVATTTMMVEIVISQGELMMSGLN